ncbi:MAG: hypothetical protein JSU74_09720 [Candidatus Zixiibacteriota bacterium]|nr:MAG: hypothetical protein JSU74_09720 [candidate division Zixibacteria bacterium]
MIYSNAKMAYDLAARQWQSLTEQSDDLLMTLALVVGSAWLAMSVLAATLDWLSARSGRSKPVRTSTPPRIAPSRRFNVPKREPLTTGLRLYRLRD